MLPSLATAYAAVYTIDALSEMLADSERQATQRLVTVGAFVAKDQYIAVDGFILLQLVCGHGMKSGHHAHVVA